MALKLNDLMMPKWLGGGIPAACSAPSAVLIAILWIISVLAES